MLTLEEINEVGGKRRAVVIATDEDVPGDEALFLEILWKALGKYETKKRQMRGERLRWLREETNGALSGIVLVYPSLFGDFDPEVQERNRRHRKIKKEKPCQTPPRP